jgi:hypothetical protein
MALFRHTASGTQMTGSWSFTLHTTGTMSVGDANGFWSDALTAGWVGTNLVEDVYASDTILDTASTAEIDSGTDGQMTRVTATVSHAGSITGNPLPFQVAVVISLLTASATRHGRGRLYLPAPDVSMCVDGQLSSTCLTNLDAGFTALFDSLNTDGLTPIVRNRTGHSSTTVTSARVGSVFDTQRRRRSKIAETYTAITVP